VSFAGAQRRVLRNRLFPLMLGVAIVVPASLLASAAQPTHEPPVAAFVNVNVVSMEHEGVTPGQTVIVRDGRVAAIGPAGATSVSKDATLIDGTGRYLMPGLADMHIHLDEFVHARPDFGDAPLFLAYGITTVLNLRGGPEHLALRERIQKGGLLAPNLYTSGEFINEPRVRTPDEVEREVLGQARAGYDVVKYHQIVDTRTGEYLTTEWLSRPAYERMVSVARRAGIPLIGHAPVNLGLSALLEAHQPLAHVGELVPLYFLPQWRMRRYLLLVAVPLSFLLLSCIGWLIGPLVRRVRRRRARVRPAIPSRMLSVTLFFAGTAIVAAGLCVLLILDGSVGGLLLASGLGVAMAILAARMAIVAVDIWRRRTVSIANQIHLSLVTVAALMLVWGMAHWLPILWRSSDAGITRVARMARQADVLVETTLILYDTTLASPDERLRLLHEPAFNSMPRSVRERWQVLAGVDLLPGWQGVVFRNYGRFTRRLTHCLHDAGVPLMLGTDTPGNPFVIPGASAHRELQILVEIGLTPFGALQTATVVPARFLGKEDEFGTVSVGKRADLLLVETNPLVDLGSLKRPLGVMIRGQWLPAERLQRMLTTLAQER
jgi:hypothetical protein